jgi:hypothetical protein
MPFGAYAPIQGSDTISRSPVYGYEQITITNVIVLTVVLSSAITIITGLAIADPIFVAWQMNDLTAFPPDYANIIGEKDWCSSTYQHNHIFPNCIDNPTHRKQSQLGRQSRHRHRHRRNHWSHPHTLSSHPIPTHASNESAEHSLAY